uniref:MAC/Perforin domain protein n=1 Tax=Ascaris lumbricoides TaxID=6252 RepID=A0A0M3ILH1_ASCLU
MRRRHPFSPLSDDSPNTTIVGPDEISYIDGRRYEFSEGGIMKTPDASPSPWNAAANSLRTKTKLPKEFLLGASSDKEEGNLKERLAKQLARCRIWQHSSLMDGRGARRNGKRKLQTDDRHSLEANRKENNAPELIAVRRVSSSKLFRKHLF